MTTKPVAAAIALAGFVVAAYSTPVHAQMSMDIASINSNNVAVAKTTAHSERKVAAKHEAKVALGSTEAATQVQQITEQLAGRPEVMVTPGDTLTEIATAHSTTYVRLYDANPHIADPDIIKPGDKLRIPAPDEELTRRPLPAPVSPATTTQPVKAVTERASAPRAAAPADANAPAGVWDRLAQCESSGNWAINTGNGYYGGMQFTLGSWRGVGGNGYPHQASKAEQIERAKMLLGRQGWGAWPACSAKLGLR